MERADDARRLMAVCVTLGAVAQILQVLTQIPPPPTFHMDIKRNMILLVSVLGQLLFLFTLLPHLFTRDSATTKTPAIL